MIYIVWDKLLEHVMSAHKTEYGATKRCEELNEARAKEKKQEWCLDFEFDEFPLED